jgi:hypothetical protein
MTKSSRVEIVYPPEFGSGVPLDRWDPEHFLYVPVPGTLLKDGQRIDSVRRDWLRGLAEQKLKEFKAQLDAIPAAIGALAYEGAKIEVLGPDEGEFYFEIPKGTAA